MHSRDYHPLWCCCRSQRRDRWEEQEPEVRDWGAGGR